MVVNHPMAVIFMNAASTTILSVIHHALDNAHNT